MIRQLKPVEVLYDELSVRKEDVYEAFKNKNSKELVKEYLKYAMAAVDNDGIDLSSADYEKQGYGKEDFTIRLFDQHANYISIEEQPANKLEVFAMRDEKGFDTLKKNLLKTLEATFVEDEDGVYNHSSPNQFKEKLEDHADKSNVNEIMEEIRTSKDFYTYFGFYNVKYNKMMEFLKSQGGFEDMSLEEKNDILRMNGYEDTMKQLKAVELSMYDLLDSMKKEIKR